MNDKIFFQKVSRVLEEIIKKKKIIIGINYYGAVLASVLGYKYNKPFTYLFDKDKKVDEIESQIGSIPKEDIILVVDVVVFGETLYRIIENLYKNQIINEECGVEVIVLFERKYQKNDIEYFSKLYESRFINKIYILNDSFDIELCSKSKEECFFWLCNRSEKGQSE